jgi:hypothetical protein
MPRARTEAIRVSVSELLSLLLGESYAPREILEENRLIHHRLGLDGDEEYNVVLGPLDALDRHKSEPISAQNVMASRPLIITCRPDLVLGETIYELKVLRRYSDRERLIIAGLLQLQLELYALGFERGKLLIYRHHDGELEEIDVRRDDAIALEALAIYLKLLEARSRLFSKLSEIARSSALGS